MKCSRSIFALLSLSLCFSVRGASEGDGFSNRIATTGSDTGRVLNSSAELATVRGFTETSQIFPSHQYCSLAPFRCSTMTPLGLTLTRVTPDSTNFGKMTEIKNKDANIIYCIERSGATTYTKTIENEQLQHE